MSLRPRREIVGLERCSHGGIVYTELEALGIAPENVIDFSVCTNPFMPPPGVTEALGSVGVRRYPDSESSALRRELAARLDTPVENIVAGSGTTELIRLIATAYFRRTDRVLVLEPAYGEYETAVLIAGARPVRNRASEENYFTPDIGEIIRLVRECQPRAVFICNPNNPTGRYLARHDVESIMEAAGDGLLVLDEAYIDFVDKNWNSLDLIGQGNVLVLRSMTKTYGIPGLRLGYAVAATGIIDVLRRVCPPWNVNNIAQEAGVRVLKEQDYLMHSFALVREAKDFLVNSLSRLGFGVLPSDSNFFLVKVGSAAECRLALLRQGILVRDCSSFGLPEYIRVAPRPLPECEKLIAAFRDLLSGL